MNPWFKAAYYLTLFAPLTAAIVVPNVLFPFIVGKYVFFRLLVDLAAIFVSAGILFRPGEVGEFLVRLKNFWRSPLGLTITAFVAIFVLAGFFGVNPSFSFWSNFERGEGGLQMLHLYGWLLLLVGLFRGKKDWRRLFYFSAVSGVLVCVYGFLAANGIAGFIGAKFTEDGFRFQGSIGNPAYVAAYLIFSLIWILVLLRDRLISRKVWEPAGVALILSAGLFAWVFFLAQTRGAFLGLLAALVFGLGYLVFHNPRFRKWAVGLLGVAVLAAGIIFVFRNSPALQNFAAARIFQVSFAERTFGTRLDLWQMAWEGAKERPVLGWGPENFITVFDRKFNPEFFQPAAGFGAWYDRAHSIYFDALVSTGFLGLLSLLSLWAAFFWTVVKSRLVSGERALAIAAATAYLVQGLVLFDVLVIYLSMFTLLAWVVAHSLPETDSKTNV